MKKFIPRCHEQAAIKAAVARIRRYCLCKQKIMIRKILKLEAYRRNSGYCVTVAPRQLRTLKVNPLLQRHANGSYRKILFTEVNILTVEEQFNRQNVRVYARSSRKAREKISKYECRTKGSSSCIFATKDRSLSNIFFSTKVMF